MAAIHPDRARSVGRRGFYICSNPALYSFRMALRPSRSGRRADSTLGVIDLKGVDVAVLRPHEL